MNKKLARRLIGRDLRLSPVPLSLTWTLYPIIIPEYLNVWRMEEVKANAYSLTNPQGYRLDLPAELALSYTGPDVLELRAQIIVQGRKLTLYPLRVYRWDMPLPFTAVTQRTATQRNTGPASASASPVLVSLALGLMLGLVVSS